MNELNQSITANWHLTDRCNYRCRFCFANCFDRRSIKEPIIPAVIEGLGKNGVKKLNLAGGEPLLSDMFASVARSAKDAGLTLSLVTNGSLLKGRALDVILNHMDWVGLSIDSCSEGVEVKLGRGKGGHVERGIALSQTLRDNGIKLKINTVVTSLNVCEDLRPLILRTKPQRWKVFRMLEVKGQNDGASRLAVDRRSFQGFVRRHEDIVLENGSGPVFEDNQDMVGSYLMIAPNGDLFKNTGFGYQYLGLDSWIENGWQSFFDYDRFVRRGGEYDW